MCGVDLSAWRLERHPTTGKPAPGQLANVGARGSSEE